MANWNGPPRCTSVSGRPSSPGARSTRREVGKLALAVALIAASVFPVEAARSQTEILDRILAIVGGQVIMRSDVRAFMALQLVEIPPGPDQESQVLTYLIERRLVLDQIDRVVAEPEPALVDRRFGLVGDRFASAEDFAVVLERVGLTSDDVRRVLADDIRRDAYLADRFALVGKEAREQAQTNWVADLVRRGQVRLVSDLSR